MAFSTSTTIEFDPQVPRQTDTVREGHAVLFTANGELISLGECKATNLESTLATIINRLSGTRTLMIVNSNQSNLHPHCWMDRLKGLERSDRLLENLRVLELPISGNLWAMSEPGKLGLIWMSCVNGALNPKHMELETEVDFSDESWQGYPADLKQALAVER